MRVYKVRVHEPCETLYNDSCEVATITLVGESANDAIRKAVEKVSNVTKLGELFAGSVECISLLSLYNN